MLDDGASLAVRLLARELRAAHPGGRLTFCRRAAAALPPSASAAARAPADTPFRFSACGRVLLGFDPDWRSLVAWTYLGPTGTPVVGIPTNGTSDRAQPPPPPPRQFGDFFAPRFRLPVLGPGGRASALAAAPGGALPGAGAAAADDVLSPAVCMPLRDGGRFVLLASCARARPPGAAAAEAAAAAAPAAVPGAPATTAAAAAARAAAAAAADPTAAAADADRGNRTCLHVVDIVRGEVAGGVRLDPDERVELLRAGADCGVSASGDSVAVLLRRSGDVLVLRCGPSGQLTEERRVGAWARPDDALVVALAEGAEARCRRELEARGRRERRRRQQREREREQARAAATQAAAQAAAQQALAVAVAAVEALGRKRARESEQGAGGGGAGQRSSRRQGGGGGERGGVVGNGQNDDDNDDDDDEMAVPEARGGEGMEREDGDQGWDSVVPDLSGGRHADHGARPSSSPPARSGDGAAPPSPPPEEEEAGRALLERPDEQGPPAVPVLDAAGAAAAEIIAPQPPPPPLLSALRQRLLAHAFLRAAAGRPSEACPSLADFARYAYGELSRAVVLRARLTGAPGELLLALGVEGEGGGGTGEGASATAAAAAGTAAASAGAEPGGEDGGGGGGARWLARYDWRSARVRDLRYAGGEAVLAQMLDAPEEVLGLRAAAAVPGVGGGGGQAGGEPGTDACGAASGWERAGAAAVRAVLSRSVSAWRLVARPAAQRAALAAQLAAGMPGTAAPVLCPSPLLDPSYLRPRFARWGEEEEQEAGPGGGGRRGGGGGGGGGQGEGEGGAAARRAAAGSTAAPEAATDASPTQLRMPFILYDRAAWFAESGGGRIVFEGVRAPPPPAASLAPCLPAAGDRRRSLRSAPFAPLAPRFSLDLRPLLAAASELSTVGLLFHPHDPFAIAVASRAQGPGAPTGEPAPAAPILVFYPGGGGR